METKEKRKYRVVVEMFASESQARLTHEWIVDRVYATTTSREFPTMEVSELELTSLYKYNKLSSWLSMLNGMAACVLPILNLTKVIDWNWWLVFAPVWGPFTLTLGYIGIMIFLITMKYAYRSFKKKNGS